MQNVYLKTISSDSSPRSTAIPDPSKTHTKNGWSWSHDLWPGIPGLWSRSRDCDPWSHIPGYDPVICIILFCSVTLSLGKKKQQKKKHLLFVCSFVFFDSTCTFICYQIINTLTILLHWLTFSLNGTGRWSGLDGGNITFAINTSFSQCAVTILFPSAMAYSIKIKHSKYDTYWVVFNTLQIT